MAAAVRKSDRLPIIDSSIGLGSGVPGTSLQSIKLRKNDCFYFSFFGQFHNALPKPFVFAIGFNEAANIHQPEQR